MVRLGPEEDPVRSALTSTSGKYARKAVKWGSIFSTKYFIVFENMHSNVHLTLSIQHDKHNFIKQVLNLN